MSTNPSLLPHPVVVPLGITEPSFYDQITINGRVLDMDGAFVFFLMRPLLSRTASTDAAGFPIAPKDINGNNVGYNWQPSDVAVEGQFMAWWHFTLPGSSAEETPEFPIIVSDHGPGLGTQIGEVVDIASSYLPVTLDALRRDPRYGDRFLQNRADVIKYRVMGALTPTDQEFTLHPLLLDYLGKRLALELCTAAEEYWSRQYRSQVTTGTSENASYPDMIATIKDLRERLICELKDDWRQLRVFSMTINLPQRRILALPASSLGPANDLRNRPITVNPYIGRPLETGNFGLEGDLGIYPFP